MLYAGDPIGTGGFIMVPALGSCIHAYSSANNTAPATAETAKPPISSSDHGNDWLRRGVIDRTPRIPRAMAGTTAARTLSAGESPHRSVEARSPSAPGMAPHRTKQYGRDLESHARLA